MHAFSFTPLSDDELARIENEKNGLLPIGTYKFQVKEVTREISKTSQNAMLKIRLSVKAENGDIANVTDYLVNTPKMLFKLKHFLESINMPHLYTQGNFDPQVLVNKVGYANIGIQKGNPKDDGSGNFPDKNNVKDYVKSIEAVVKPVAKPVPVFDDIPF
ncbi:MAG: hypothetical protein WC753_04735 [Candidatus Gracilibacteria bacterium]|jgi:hypothetical protein